MQRQRFLAGKLPATETLPRARLMAFLNLNAKEATASAPAEIDMREWAEKTRCSNRRDTLQPFGQGTSFLKTNKATYFRFAAFPAWAVWQRRDRHLTVPESNFRARLPNDNSTCSDNWQKWTKIKTSSEYYNAFHSVRTAEIRQLLYR